eukprot:10563250-Prorocentrum_lima.AAC.1
MHTTIHVPSWMHTMLHNSPYVWYVGCKVPQALTRAEAKMVFDIDGLLTFLANMAERYSMSGWR